ILKATKPEEAADFSATETDPEETATPQQGKYAKLFAILVPVVLLIVVSIMIYRAIFDRGNVISGGDATGFLGGTAIILLLISTFGHLYFIFFEKIIDLLREEFYFAIKNFAPVIPIS